MQSVQTIDTVLVRLPNRMAKPIILTECIPEDQYTEKEMKEVTSDLIDIRDIAKDTSILIGQQGESIDNIEKSVEASHKSIEEGAEELEQALEEKKKERGMMLPLLVGLGVGTAVAGPIGFLLSSHIILGVACLAVGGSVGVGGGYLVNKLTT